MKKESEIKIIEQIEKLIQKLIKGDTYFRDDLDQHKFKLEDIDQMISNVKNDFPITLHTHFRESIEKVLDVYKKRCNALAIRVRGQAFSIRTYENTINDLEGQNKALRQSYETILNLILDIKFADTVEGRSNYEDNAIKAFPMEMVIRQKIQRNYPLSGSEMRFLDQKLQS